MPRCRHPRSTRLNRTTRVTRVTRAAAPVLLAVGLLIGPGAALAQAHNVLLTTNPASGSTVGVLPPLIVLHYDLPAQSLGTVVRVQGPAGDAADGPAQLIDTDVDQPIRLGSPAGKYTVAWRVVSADGHVVQGSFSFTALGASTATASPLPSAVPARLATGGGSDHSAVLLWGSIGAGVVVVAAVIVVAARRTSRRGPGAEDEDFGDGDEDD